MDMCSSGDDGVSGGVWWGMCVGKGGWIRIPVWKCWCRCVCACSGKHEMCSVVFAVCSGIHYGIV